MPAGNGSSASTVVGPPAGLATRNRPSMAASRELKPGKSATVLQTSLRRRRRR